MESFGDLQHLPGRCLYDRGVSQPAPTAPARQRGMNHRRGRRSPFQRRALRSRLLARRPRLAARRALRLALGRFRGTPGTTVGLIPGRGTDEFPESCPSAASSSAIRERNSAITTSRCATIASRSTTIASSRATRSSTLTHQALPTIARRVVDRLHQATG
jgi:hypothetical protein